MTTATQAKKTATPTFPALTHADRSDACASGAVQALVRVVKGKKELLLDNHSFNLHQAALIGQGWTVAEDIREAVLFPPKTAFDTSDH
jgi:hypothetical protein